MKQSAFKDALTRGLSHLERRQAIRADALDDIQTAAAVTWSGNTYPATVSTERREILIDPAGNPIVVTLTVHIRSDLFLVPDPAGATSETLLAAYDSGQTKPQSGDRITYQGRTFVVRSVTQTDAYYALLCGDAASGGRS